VKHPQNNAGFSLVPKILSCYGSMQLHVNAVRQTNTNEFDVYVHCGTGTRSKRDKNPPRSRNSTVHVRVPCHRYPSAP